jgi:hypothetical protein
MDLYEYFATTAILLNAMMHLIWPFGYGLPYPTDKNDRESFVLAFLPLLLRSPTLHLFVSLCHVFLSSFLLFLVSALVHLISLSSTSFQIIYENLGLHNHYVHCLLSSPNNCPVFVYCVHTNDSAVCA